VKTTWDAERYSDRLDPRNDGFNKDKELSLLKHYEPLFNPIRLLAEPAICTDMHMNILLWYLPRILTRERQASPCCSEPVSTPDRTDRRLFGKVYGHWTVSFLEVSSPMGAGDQMPSTFAHRTLASRAREPQTSLRLGSNKENRYVPYHHGSHSGCR
jgi:hypothetical protein